MKRRTIIKSSAVVLGYGLSAGTIASLISGCKAETGDGWQGDVLNKKQADILADVTERIIPRTDTPGANDALVHRTIDQFMRDNVSEEDAGAFANGLMRFDEVARDVHGKRFTSLTDEQQDEVLNAVADEGGDENIFEAVKALTIPAFFTSEIGAKEVLKFDPIPGGWQACIPLSEVGGTWAL